MVRIDGEVAAGFEPVADAFRNNFVEHGDTGAACAVYQHGIRVVDIWAGTSGHGPWRQDTRSVVFSVSKGITTVCLLMAVEDGHLDLDAHVADYWPEFAAAGKGHTTVRQLLAHQAGLMGPAERMTAQDLHDWTPVTEALARQRPSWVPGEAYGYHAVTFGWLAGEVLRRATGKRPSDWLRERIATPLGLRATFGASLTDPDLALQGEQLPILQQPTGAADDPTVVNQIIGMNGAYNGLDLFGSANTDAFLDAEMPAANLVTSAADLARMYAATVADVDGVRLLRPETINDARLPQSAGTPFLGPANGLRWGTGFMLNSPERRMAGDGSFGHDGAGGQLAFAHLEHGLSFGYATIRPGGLPDERAELLSAALRACL
jgi:CubicO group peptidase (beta-lactamase class C family)